MALHQATPLSPQNSVASIAIPSLPAPIQTSNFSPHSNYCVLTTTSPPPLMQAANSTAGMGYPSQTQATSQPMFARSMSPSVSSDPESHSSSSITMPTAQLVYAVPASSVYMQPGFSNLQSVQQFTTTGSIVGSDGSAGSITIPHTVGSPTLVAMPMPMPVSIPTYTTQAATTSTPPTSQFSPTMMLNKVNGVVQPYCKADYLSDCQQGVLCPFPHTCENVQEERLRLQRVQSTKIELEIQKVRSAHPQDHSLLETNHDFDTTFPSLSTVQSIPINEDDDASETSSHSTQPSMGVTFRPEPTIIPGDKFDSRVTFEQAGTAVKVNLGSTLATPSRHVSSRTSADVCYDFQNHGKCNRGDRCRYQHIPAHQSLCMDWEAGNCRRGEQCRFAHRHGNDIYEGPRSRKKVELGTSGRTDSSSTPLPAPIDPKDVCFDFQNKGECKRGDSCPYRHVAAELCYCINFQSGECRRGASCRYRHEYINKTNTTTINTNTITSTPVNTASSNRSRGYPRSGTTLTTRDFISQTVRSPPISSPISSQLPQSPPNAFSTHPSQFSWMPSPLVSSVAPVTTAARGSQGTNMANHVGTMGTMYRPTNVAMPMPANVYSLAPSLAPTTTVGLPGHIYGAAPQYSYNATPILTPVLSCPMVQPESRGNGTAHGAPTQLSSQLSTTLVSLDTVPQ